MPKGIMFHHFHGKKHSKVLGSIGKKEFEKIIKYLKKNYTLLSAQEFISKALNKNLKSREICLTFDDNLKSQFDVAFPVLKKEKLTAFFFIYSSVFDKKFNLMEIFRDFSNKKFKNRNNFYNMFFHLFQKFYFKKYLEFKKKFNHDYLKNYKFYSLFDRKYRYARDKILNNKEFEKILIYMMKLKKYNIFKNYKKLFMNKSQIKELIIHNNLIGLHSHNHFVNLKKISLKNQIKDYKKNYNFIYKNFNVPPIAASYPFGRYNLNTIKTLKKLKIKIAFLSKQTNQVSNYKISRIDHTYLLKFIK